jgi:hypothetical protein
MLRIVHPPSFVPERHYIFQVVLGDWLGLEYIAEPGPVECLEITRTQNQSRDRLQINDAFFSAPVERWLTKAALPKSIQSWTPSPALPGVPSPLAVLCGEKLENGDYVMAQPRLIRLGLDIMGSAFFLLSRYEELINPERDQFDRFASRSSVLRGAGLLQRPILNELVELLWWALHRLWPELVRKTRSYRCLLSSDFDNCEIMGVSLPRAARILIGRSVREALRQGPWHSAFRRAWRYRQAWQGVPTADGLDDFDTLMDLSEQHGLKWVFNLIAEHGALGKDGHYEIHRRGIRRLMRRIHGRGHELGFHGSYETFRDPARVRREFDYLFRIAQQEGVAQSAFGGRQHYLRWEAPTTWEAYAQAGLAYDSTLGYADYAGFRCGTCYEFPVFNLRTRQALTLRERPLVVMECSLWNSAYMALSLERALEVAGTLSDTCRSYRGDFTLLWHNGQTRDPVMRETLAAMLGKAA